MSDQIFARKVKLEVNPETERILDGQSRICNWLFNHLLQMCDDDFEMGKPRQLLQGRNLRNQVPLLKQEFPFLKAVHASPLKNVALRLKQSFKDFFQIQERGKPHFRSWKDDWFSLQFEDKRTGWKLDGRNLQISLGTGIDRKRHSVKVKLAEPLKLAKSHSIKGMRLIKEDEQFVAVFTIQDQAKARKPISRSIFIDPNCKNLAVAIDSEGKSIEFSRLPMTKFFDNQIDQLKSKRDKCKKKSLFVPTGGKGFWKPSKRWQRVNRAIRKLRRAKREQTKQCFFTTANWIARNFDAVAFGDWSPSLETATQKTMHRSMLNQTMIAQFRRITDWVMQRSGKTFIEVDERNSTATCCKCGDFEKKSPEIREFTCKNCSAHLSRDINAAVNHGLKSGLLPGSGWQEWNLSIPDQIVHWNPWDCQWQIN